MDIFNTFLWVTIPLLTIVKKEEYITLLMKSKMSKKNLSKEIDIKNRTS